MDLIYGNEGQTARRWQRSLDCALEWQPEELYLYPLYVRKLTNLERVGKRPGDHRRDLYCQARDCLLESGYRQVSMRLFRRRDVCRSTDYCCQDDGMIGLGSGARSYTRALHYSTEYAVGQAGVRRIIEAFNARDASSHGVADHGIHLDIPEQQRRYVIKSLLRVDGICHAGYRERFGGSAMEDLPQLRELLETGLATDSGDALQLTPEGLSWSDTIGPWLYSDATVSRMNACVLV